MATLRNSVFLTFKHSTIAQTLNCSVLHILLYQNEHGHHSSLKWLVLSRSSCKLHRYNINCCFYAVYEYFDWFSFLHLLYLHQVSLIEKKKRHIQIYHRSFLFLFLSKKLVSLQNWRGNRIPSPERVITRPAYYGIGHRKNKITCSFLNHYETRFVPYYLNKWSIPPPML